MRSFCVVVFFLIGINAKNLHMKEDPTTEYIMTEEDNHFLDLSNDDEIVYGEKERYVRHVELVTESVLEHLLTEIKMKYPNSKNSTNNIPNMMKRLQMKLQHMNKKKHKKHRKAKSRNNKDLSLTTLGHGARTTKSSE